MPPCFIREPHADPPGSGTERSRHRRRIDQAPLGWRTSRSRARSSRVVPHLLSGFCASSRICGWSFLQTPSHGDALALLLAFGSADTWRGDFHPARSMPYLAHTVDMTGSNRPASDCPLDGGVMSPFAEAYARCDDRAQAKAARQTHRWPGQSTETEKSPRWRRRKEPVRACLSSRAPPPS
jgi:hypothetical protein